MLTKYHTYNPITYRQRRAMYTYVDDVLVKTTYYAGLYEQTITDGGATTTHYNYVNTIDGLSAVLIDNGQDEDLYYINRDHLGSITALIDESGSMVAEYCYDPCLVKQGFCECSETKTYVEQIPNNEGLREGRQRKPTNWLGYTTPNFDIITRGYTGHVQRNTFFESAAHKKKFVEQIPTLKIVGKHLPFPNLINMNGRVYDPITARFLSPDPFVQNPASSQDYNRYTYVNNNPMRFTDPSGYTSGPILNWLKGVFGGWQHRSQNRVPYGSSGTGDNISGVDDNYSYNYNYLNDFLSSMLAFDFLSTPTFGGGDGGKHYSSFSIGGNFALGGKSNFNSSNESQFAKFKICYEDPPKYQKLISFIPIQRFIMKGIFKRGENFHKLTFGIYNWDVNLELPFYKTNEVINLSNSNNTPFNFNATEWYKIIVSFTPAGSLVTANLNGRTFNSFTQINNNNLGTNNLGQLTSGFQHTFNTGGNLQINFPQGTIYDLTVFKREKYSIRLNIFLLWFKIH